MTNNNEKKPWDRQKNERGYTYSLFNEYLKLGPLRTISKLCTKLQKTAGFSHPPSKRTLQDYSLKWCWRERAEAYDENRINLERQGLEVRARDRLIKRLEQNEKEENALHNAIMDALDKDKIIGYDKKGEPIYPTLGQRAYAVDCFSKAKKNASDSQRLDYGQPISISKDSLDLKKKKDDREISELKDLFELAEQANKRKGEDS